MPSRQKIIAALLMLACLVVFSACASGPHIPRKLDLPKDRPIYLHPVKNLSGVPLSKLDPDLYYADNLEHLAMLAKGKTLSFPELLREAVAVALRDDGFIVSDDPKERLQVFLSVSEWSAEKVKERGHLWLVIDGVLVDRIDLEEPLMEARSAHWHQLLEGDPDPNGVLGTMRLISGAYQRIAIDAALDLLIKAGVLQSFEVAPTLTTDEGKQSVPATTPKE